MTTRRRSRRSSVFSKKHYHSGDGMLTTAWGPALWHFLHMVSFNYPIKPTELEKKRYRDFLLNLQYILPCKYCRDNLSKYFKNKPLTIKEMKNRDSFSHYIYTLHENINTLLKKKPSKLTYATVRERYEHFRARCTQKKPAMLPTIPKEDEKEDKEDKDTKNNKKEKGCTEPLNGKKAKCIIHIVPQEDKRETFQMHKDCLKTRQKK